MSYTEYNNNGTIVYLCWNCGKIHINEEETQHEHIDNNFLNRLIDKANKKKDARVWVCGRGCGYTDHHPLPKDHEDQAGDFACPKCGDKGLIAFLKEEED